MELWLAVLISIVGIVVLFKGGDIFVNSSSYIASYFGIPMFIIASTIVAVATSAPEIIVSAISTYNASNEMAVGNAIGSVSANTGLILALGLLLTSFESEDKIFVYSSLIAILSVLVLYLGCIKGALSNWSIFVLFVLLIAFFYLNIAEAKKNNSNLGDILTDDEKTPKKLVVNIVLFVVGLLGLVFGSKILIKGATEIALYFHISQRIISITLVAVGTSLPELVTTIVAVAKKNSHLLIGNVVGSNIIDVSLILPLCSLVSFLKTKNANFIIPKDSINIDMPVCLALTVISLIPILLFKKSFKWQGVAVLSIYIGYMVYTFV